MRNHMKSKHKIRVGFKPITQRSISVELKPSIDKSWMDELEDDHFKKYESDNPIWDYFLRDKNQEKAKCITCPDSILSIKNGNTGSMRNHMKLKHKIKVGLKPNAQNTYHDTHESVWIKKDHHVKDRINPGPDPYKKNFNTRVWKSFVWQYFTWLESGKATCNYCSKEFKTEEKKRLPMWISGLRWWVWVFS